MKTFPTPRYRLGAQANRLMGSSLPPHYIYLDAAAIIALHTSFPIDPTERQDTILKSLGPSIDNVPQIFVTAPLEIMIVDYLKQAHPRKKNGCGVMFGDLPRLGWGQPVVQSYGSMRCEFYLIQPFILEDLDVAAFKIAGDLDDVSIQDDCEFDKDPTNGLHMLRMELRIDGIEQCAKLLKTHHPNSTHSFILMGSRMTNPFVQDMVNRKLRVFGDTNFGNVDLLSLVQSRLSTIDARSLGPIPHPSIDVPAFAIPNHDSKQLPMNLESIPHSDPPYQMNALDGSDIYLAFDTRVHSIFENELIELSSYLGRNIRLVSIPTVTVELAKGHGGSKGHGGKARRKILGCFKRGKVESFGIHEMDVGPIPTMNVDGTISVDSVKGDVDTRSEITLIMKQTVDKKPGRRVTFLVGTFDIGFQLLCSAIDGGRARVLVPKLKEGDREQFVKVIFNILYPLLEH